MSLSSRSQAFAKERAAAALHSIPHAHCQKAIETRWRVDADGRVSPASVLWLYCWAKTGQGSEAAKSTARLVFDEILSVPYEQFEQTVPHGWARRMRYRPDLSERDFRRWFDGPLT